MFKGWSNNILYEMMNQQYDHGKFSGEVSYKTTGKFLASQS